MDLGFVGSLVIVGPDHGEHGIDQRAIDSHQFTEAVQFLDNGNRGGGLPQDMFIKMNHLLQAARVEHREECALIDAAGKHVVGGSKALLCQDLEEVSSREVFLDMIISLDFQLVFGAGPVSACLRYRGICRGRLEGCE